MLAPYVKRIGCDLDGPRSSPSTIYFYTETGAVIFECDPLEVYERAPALLAALSERGREIVAQAWAEAKAARSH